MGNRHRFKIMLVAGVVVASGLAYASALDDQNAARNLTRDGASLGWNVKYLWPPDPCYPPDPCKAGIGLTIDADRRVDLDQQVVFQHLEGGLINPCIRVLHRFLADGSMSETINVLDADDAVRITVPDGYVLVPGQGGYVLAPAP